MNRMFVGMLVAMFVMGCSTEDGSAGSTVERPLTCTFDINGVCVSVGETVPLDGLREELEFTLANTLEFWGADWEDAKGVAITMLPEVKECEHPWALGCFDRALNAMVVPVEPKCRTLHIPHMFGHMVSSDPGHIDSRWFSVPDWQLAGCPGPE